MEEKNQDTVFRIRRGGEHGLYICENILDSKEFMFPAYQMALSALAEIVGRAQNLKEARRQRTQQKWNWNSETMYSSGNSVSPGILNSPDTLDLYDYDNNIIGFFGGRGQGKSSTMLSFVRGLELHNTQSLYPFQAMNTRLEQEKVLHLNIASNAKFFVLPPIDPTSFEARDSIVEMVLSQLFHHSEQMWKRASEFIGSGRFTEDAQVNLLKCFRKCLESVHTMHTRQADNSDDPMEALYRLGDSVDLKIEFYHLLNIFFSLIDGDVDDCFLVISVDDTDMKFDSAYIILEEIRKYLSLPNVIVVISADYDQLRTLVVQHFYAELDIATKKDIVTSDTVNLMATKYLDKLIPSSHMIFLPQLRVRFERDMELTLKIDEMYHQQGGSVSPNDDIRDVRLQGEIFRLIREKTGMVFIRHRHYMHELIPETLRDFQHLYRLLDRMPPPDPELSLTELAGDEARRRAISPEPDRNVPRTGGQVDPPLTADVWRSYCQRRLERAKLLLANLTTFQNYFINDWCDNELNYEDFKIIKAISEVVTPQIVKYATVLVRQKVARRERELSASTETELRQDYWRGLYEPPTDEDALHEAACYVDLQNTLKKLSEDYSFTQREYAFGFAVKTILTICFNRLALEQQKRDLSQALDEAAAYSGRPGERNERVQSKFFTFDYRRIQTRLSPGLFDSERIQKVFSDKTGTSILFCATIPDVSGVSDSVFYREPGENGGSAYCDLLNCFYSMLNPAAFASDPAGRDESIEGNFYVTAAEQERVLRCQDLSIYVCCNWDVQSQIVKSILEPYKQEDKRTVADGQFLGNLSQAVGDMFWTYNNKVIPSSYSAFLGALKKGAMGSYFVNAFFFYIFRFLRTKDADPFDIGVMEDAPLNESGSEGGMNVMATVPLAKKLFTEHFIYPPYEGKASVGARQLVPLRHMRPPDAAGKWREPDERTPLTKTAKQIATSGELLAKAMDHLAASMEQASRERAGKEQAGKEQDSEAQTGDGDTQ